MLLSLDDTMNVTLYEDSFMSLSVTEIFIAHSTHLAEKSSQVKSFPGILLEGLLKVIVEAVSKKGL